MLRHPSNSPEPKKSRRRKYSAIQSRSKSTSPSDCNSAQQSTPTKKRRTKRKRYSKTNKSSSNSSNRKSANSSNRKSANSSNRQSANSSNRKSANSSNRKSRVFKPLNNNHNKNDDEYTEVDIKKLTKTLSKHKINKKRTETFITVLPYCSVDMAKDQRTPSNSSEKGKHFICRHRKNENAAMIQIHNIMNGENHKLPGKIDGLRRGVPVAKVLNLQLQRNNMIHSLRDIKENGKKSKLYVKFGKKIDSLRRTKQITEDTRNYIYGQSKLIIKNIQNEGANNQYDLETDWKRIQKSYIQTYNSEQVENEQENEEKEIEIAPILLEKISVKKWKENKNKIEFVEDKENKKESTQIDYGSLCVADSVSVEPPLIVN